MLVSSMSSTLASVTTVLDSSQPKPKTHTQTPLSNGPSNATISGVSETLLAQSQDRTIQDGFTVQDPPLEPVISRRRAALIIVTVGLMTMMGTVLSGVLAVALPKVADDIKLEESLLLWPASIYSLTCGCTLLFFGSIADVVGARIIYLTGSVFSTALILACGLSRTGIQLILFRALHGFAISMCLPSSVSILTNNFKPGQRRNTAFACLGAAQPTGFLVGLVLGGILTDRVSWRASFYLIASMNAAVFVVTVFCLPKSADEDRRILQRFRTEIDWVGVLLISSALGLLSYVLAAVMMQTSLISSSTNICLLVLSILLLPTFALWVHLQEKNSRPALIPNSLWRNSVFLSICILVFLAWGTVTANQYFLALFFEKVQHLSALSTSIRFLPLVASGVLANVATGVLVRHVHAGYLISVAIVLSAITPLITALADPAWPYWYAAFPATILSPIAADVVLTVANLSITAIFPSKTHGLAGGVSNTLAQIGTSLGLNLTSILATSVSVGSRYSDKTSADALELGYRASFWASFGATVCMLAVVVLGLRKIGKVGAVKRD